MIVTPTIHFNGQCEAAVRLYHAAFDARIGCLFHYSDRNKEDFDAPLTQEQEGYVYHAEIHIGKQRIMMSDEIDNTNYAPFLTVTFDCDEDVKKAYEVLKENGRIVVPMHSTTYSSCAVSLVDRFGVRWGLMTENSASKAELDVGAEKRIVDFLIRAKQATYVGNGGEAMSSRPNSHDLQYEEGSLTYIDTYLGSDSFAGEEALWEGGKPFWAMNYVGRVVGENFSGDFLKEALLRMPTKNPFRGPTEYTNGHYRYRCSVKGDFHWFSGTEEIDFDGGTIYECAFQGGDVKEEA